MALAWLAWAALALAGDGVVRTEIDGDAVVNWTELRIEVSAARNLTLLGGIKHVSEQAAVDDVVKRMPEVVMAVPLRHDAVFGSVDRVAARVLDDWGIVEARYHPSGEVFVIGATKLRSVIEPWAIARALGMAPTGLPSGPSGIVVDARGDGATPCYAPQFVSVDGDVLYDSRLWLDAARTRAPAVWVSTPVAVRVTEIAGYEPLLLLAQEVSGCKITLGARDTAFWREKVEGTRAVGAGHVVIVVDP